MLIYSIQQCYKVIYPKHSKHWLPIYCGTHNWLFVLLNIRSQFKSWVIIFFTFQGFCVKIHPKLIWKSRFLFSLIYQFYLMYRLICQKPAHFLSAKMALVGTFFQMFIVLGMYISAVLANSGLWPLFGGSHGNSLLSPFAS